MDADVVEEDGTVVAQAAFEFGDMSGIGGTSLNLCATDRIRINDTVASRREDPVTNRVYYEVTFDMEAPEYEFRFSREGVGDVVATVSLPPAFTITAPGAGSEVSRAAGLPLAWDPPGEGTMEISADVELVDDAYCMDEFDVVTDDDGAHAIPPEDLAPPDDPAPDQCGATITFTRSQKGSYPPEFSDGGSIEASRIRSVEITSVP